MRRHSNAVLFKLLALVSLVFVCAICFRVALFALSTEPVWQHVNPIAVPVITDEFAYLFNTIQLSNIIESRQFFEKITNQYPLAYSFFLAVVFQFTFGNSTTADTPPTNLVMLSYSLNILMVLAIISWVIYVAFTSKRKLLSIAIGIVLLGLHPALIYYSLHSTPETLLTALLIVSAGSFFLSLERDFSSRMYAIMMSSALCALLLKETSLAILFLPIIYVVFQLKSSKMHRKHILLSTSIISGLLLLFFSLFLIESHYLGKELLKRGGSNLGDDVSIIMINSHLVLSTLTQFLFLFIGQILYATSSIFILPYLIVKLTQNKIRMTDISLVAVAFGFIFIGAAWFSISDVEKRLDHFIYGRYSFPILLALAIVYLKEFYNSNISVIVKTLLFQLCFLLLLTVFTLALPILVAVSPPVFFNIPSANFLLIGEHLSSGLWQVVAAFGTLTVVTLCAIMVLRKTAVIKKPSVNAVYTLVFLVSITILNLANLIFNFSYYKFEKVARWRQQVAISNFINYFSIQDQVLCFDSALLEGGDLSSKWDYWALRLLLASTNSRLITQSCKWSMSEWVATNQNYSESTYPGYDKVLNVVDSDVEILKQKNRNSQTSDASIISLPKLKYVLLSAEYKDNHNLDLNILSLDTSIWESSTNSDNFHNSVKIAIQTSDAPLEQTSIRCELPHYVYPGQRFRASCSLPESSIDKISIDIIKENFEWSHNINGYYYEIYPNSSISKVFP